jgi:RNA polymerase sigma-70 factor (ECF subfamily)
MSTDSRDAADQLLDRGSGRSLDTLLAEADWLARLARRLVRDAAAADDLVQETWLAALRAGRAAPHAPRAWLGAIARNLASKARRGQQRRERRERVAAREEASAQSPEALLEKAEAHRSLVDAVLRLDEPYRGLVLLHEFEGVPLAEIARREGVPQGTVRWRMQEARKRLRAALDDEFGMPGSGPPSCCRSRSPPSAEPRRR